MQGRLNYERIQPAGDWPKLKAKAAAVRHLVKYSHHLSILHDDGTQHARLRRGVNQLICRFYDIFGIRRSLSFRRLKKRNIRIGKAHAFNTFYTMPPVLTVQHSGKFKLGPDTMPLPGASRIIHVFSGYALILILPMDDLIEREFTVETMENALKDDTFMENVSKLPMFGVAAKHSLYVPPGHLPVIVGLPQASDKDKKKKDVSDEDDALAYLSYYHCGGEMQEVLTDETRVEMAAVLDKAIARKGKVVNDHTQKLKQWVDSWRMAA